MLGYSGGTSPMNAIEKASAVIVIGSDLKAESAGFAYRVIQAVTKNDSKLILASSRSTSLNRFANSFLQFKPGSEAWLVAGLNKAILAEGVADSALIGNITSGLDALKVSLDALSFEQITAATNISEAALREAALLAVNGGRTAVIYGADVIRSADMANAVKGAVNLALLTGAVGESGAGIYPLDEKNNTQGMLDMGVCPEYLPGYHTYERMAATFSSSWNSAVPATAGRDLFQILEGIEKGEIKALYVMGNDPLHFMPDRNRVLTALQKLELLIVQDLFLTEAARLATVVLPAATAAEKSGSFTSIDNRVHCFSSAVSPSGQARTDSEILAKLISLIAPVATVSVQTAEELHHEITTLTGLYNEVCDHAGCRMGRRKNRASFSEKPAAFAAVAPSAMPVSAGSFSLTVGPVLHHNGSMTLWSENNMSVAGQGYVTVNPADAANAGISSGAAVKLISAAGSTTLSARLSDSVQPGALFVPSHFRESPSGQLLKGPANTIAVTLEKA
jgi:formate dehydrogenase alpha subunit